MKPLTEPVNAPGGLAESTRDAAEATLEATLDTAESLREFTRAWLQAEVARRSGVAPGRFQTLEPDSPEEDP